jgi:transposase InsO family protein
LIGTGVAAAGEKRAAPPAASGWAGLCADEEWCKEQKGMEQVFRGKRERLDPPPPNTLMRNALYRLGDRTVHTAARKVAALDRLVGVDAEIHGKAVDMALEAQKVREIRPAAARPASPDAGGIPAADRVPAAPSAGQPAGGADRRGKRDVTSAQRLRS